MQAISADLLKDFSVFSQEDGKVLSKIYQNIIENSSLTFADFITIRDLIELSGYNSISIHLLLLSMFSSLHNGSVCMLFDYKILVKKMDKLTGTNCKNYAKEITSTIENYPDLIYCYSNEPTLFEKEGDDYRPLILYKIEGKSYLYFQKYFRCELNFKKHLGRFIALKKKELYSLQEVAKAFREITDQFPLMLNSKPMILDDQQLVAMVLPLFKNFIVISGGPGTGKTSIIVNLIRLFLRLGIDYSKIMVAAPTGRAMQRLNSAILSAADLLKDHKDDQLLLEINASTIHRMLKYSPSRNMFLYNKYNKMRADVIIIDEVSMVDIILMSKIIESINDETVLILLGDRNQLPSVDAGSVLADLIPLDQRISFNEEIVEKIQHIYKDAFKGYNIIDHDNEDVLSNRIVVLKNNFRSNNTINEISEKINKQDEGVLGKIPEVKIKEKSLKQNTIEKERLFSSNFEFIGYNFCDSGIFRIEPVENNSASFGELSRILDLWIDHYIYTVKYNDETYYEMIQNLDNNLLYNISDPKVFKKIENIILSLQNFRILSPLRKGYFGTTGINQYLVSKLGTFFKQSTQKMVHNGMPIIILRNDYSKNLFNGDTGVVLHDEKGHFHAYFQKNNGYETYPIESLPYYEPSYAITVHKSQGSEFKNILFILPETMSDHLMTKEILYTALTRAKENVLIYGTEESLNKAILKRVERESTLPVSI